MQIGSTIQAWDLAAASAEARRLAAAGDERAQIENAAKGFELMLTRIWLQSVRSASLESGSELTSGYRTMSDDHLAAYFVNQGGFGLVNPMVEQMLKQIEFRKSGSALGNESK